MSDRVVKKEMQDDERAITSEWTQREQPGKRRRNKDEDRNEIENEGSVECTTKGGCVSQCLPEVEASFQKLSVSCSPRELEILSEMESLKKQLDLYESCLFHQKILQEARQRNSELIVTYRSCCDDLDDEDERFEPTRRLYLRLIGELEQANQKMSGIESELMKKSSMSPEVYRVRKGELDVALESLRMEMRNGNPCE